MEADFWCRWIDEGGNGGWLPSATAGPGLNGMAEGELPNWSSSWLDSRRGGDGWHVDINAHTQACEIEGKCLRPGSPWSQCDGGNRGVREHKGGQGRNERMGGGEDAIGSRRVHLGAMQLVQPIWPMAGASQRHKLEVNVADAP